MTAAHLLAEADRRVLDAAREAAEQRANGWTSEEIAVVMVDAAAIVADLRQQAADLEALAPLLWETACGQQSPMHHNLRCYREAGHGTEHLYTVKTFRRAA